MEANEAADNIQEAAEERTEEKERERFRREAAIVIGVLAMLLAITALGGDQARTTETNANIRASDAYAFYQAKYIRQTDYRLAADNLQALLRTQPSLPAAARATIATRIAADRATAARYEDDPRGGSGKKQLLAQATHYGEERDHAERQDPYFNYAQALFQIAIVLGSVSIVAAARSILRAAVGLGVVAFLLMLNGYFLIVMIT